MINEHRQKGINIIILAGKLQLVNLDPELLELKRAIAHLDLGIKAYKTAVTAETDAERLLASCGEQISHIAAAAEEALRKIREELGPEAV